MPIQTQRKGGINLQHLRNPSVKRGWVVSITPRPLYPVKDPVPIVQETGWASRQLWTRTESLAPTGSQSPDRAARSESLYRLSYPGRPQVLNFSILTKTQRIQLKKCN